MSKNEFDELLLKKLREEELEYNPAHWDRLAQLLPPTLTPNTVQKGKKWTIAAGIAAAIAFTLATVFFVKLIQKPTEQPAQPAVVQQTTTPEPSVKTPATVLPQPGPAATPQSNNTPQIAVRQRASGPSYHPVWHHDPALNNNNPANNTNNSNNGAVLPDILTPAPNPAPEMVADNHKAPEQAPVVQEIVPEKSSNQSRREQQPVYAYEPRYGTANPSAFYEGKHPDKSAKKTSISLGGGVNYGNLNTGYTAGISVRRKVAGGLFVDGSVAMMYNNNASNVAINNGPPLADNNNTAARPTAFNNETTLASPALDPIQKLYYMQFNPSIGYQIEKHVALSVGGDFQQILNNKGEQDEIVQPGTNSAKVFPNFDVGLTAKSEFSITPSIQAGLLYREGLNNMLKSEGTKYVNRRYIQVQFKYNIPVN